MRRLNIGLVSPYDWSISGGVNSHVKDLAEHLIGNGHRVSVLAPDSIETEREDYFQSAGKSVAVPYNGSIARLAFGPLVNGRVRKWITENEFDLLHLHQPTIPSTSLLACWAAQGPLVGTFHAAFDQNWITAIAAPLLEPALDKLSVRIAVSSQAKLSLINALGGDAVVIPNGVDTSFFMNATKDSSLKDSLLFLGRFEEPRKGLPVLLKAFALLKDNSRFASTKLIIAGHGDIELTREKILLEYGMNLGNQIQFLGPVSEDDKARLLSSTAAYIAPNTGSESFGIVLVEALAAGATVIASNLPSFEEVVGNAGYLFRNEDPAHLAQTIENALGVDRTIAARTRAATFDWNVIVPQLEEIYDLASSNQPKVNLVRRLER